MKTIAKIRTDFPTKFGIPRQSGLVDELKGTVIFDKKPSVLINCAGVLPTFDKFENVTIEDFKNVIDINFTSAVYSIKTLLPLLNESENGVIINIASSSALCPFAGVTSYTASKAALERFSLALAVEQTNLSVTTVLPGFTKTDVLRSQTATEKESGLIGRISASSDKVASKILRKASRRKLRVITGLDARFMDFLFKTFPAKAPKILTWFLKKSNFSTFKKI